MSDPALRAALEQLASDGYRDFMAQYQDLLAAGQGSTISARGRGAALVSALLSLAATCAVDVGLSLGTAQASLAESYRAADAKAPRFG